MALKNALIMQNDNGTTTTAIQIDTAITSNNVPVVINAAGNVGIGTSSPAQRLHLAQAGQPRIEFEDTTNSSKGRITTGGTTGSMTFDADPDNTKAGTVMTFNVDASERLRINSAGNVGIGTSSPIGKLDVTSSTFDTLFLRRTIAGSATILFRDSNNDGGLVQSQAGGSMTIHTTINNANVERLRITSAGNVGIGTSSPAGQLGATGAFVLGNQATTGSGGSGRILATGGEFFIQAGLAATSGSSAPIVFTAFGGVSERMRITSAGNVGIGTSSPIDNLHVSSGSSTYIRATRGTSGSEGNIIVGASTSTNDIFSRNVGTGAKPLTFIMGTTEAARIDASGNLLVGTTSAVNSSINGSEINSTTISNSAPSPTANLVLYKPASAAQSAFVFFNTNGSFIASITQNGNSAVSYNTTSDYRLKENVMPMVGALARVTSLNPVTYTWKSTGEVGQGFIAHELQAIVPDAVTGTKDAVDKDGNPQYQGVDASFLVATLTKAIQELSAKVDTLQAELNTLKGN